MRPSRAAVALVLGAALVAAPGAPGAAPKAKKRTVTIADDFYAPARLTVDRGTTIRWVWPQDAGDVHDVALDQGPRGEPEWASEPAASGYAFTRVLRRPGRYDLVCTLHEEMTMTVVVRKR